MDIKAFGVLDIDLKDVSDDGDPSGAFECVLSVPTVDRDGEVVDAKAFDPLPDWMPIDVDHAMTVDGTVASGQPYYEGDVLKFKGTWASDPEAQRVRSKVREGHIRKMSVAFMDADREVDEKDGRPHIRRAELLNAAIVAIPSNREANILVAKAATMKVGARNSASDQSLLQQAHDLLNQAGAACETKTEDDGKSAVDAMKDIAAEAAEKYAALMAEQKSTTEDPEEAAAPAAAPPAEPDVTQALVELSLAHAALAL